MKQSILRCAVGSLNGPRSSIWRIWGNPKGDIYVAVRSLGGIIKASFHRDGKCQVGFTSEYAKTAQARFGKDSRHWETWRLPPEPVVRVLQILVPTSELRSFLEYKTGEVVWLQPPESNLIATVSVILAPPLAEIEPPAALASARLVGTVRTSLRNAWVFYAHSSIDETLKGIIATEHAKLRKLPSPATVLPGTRAVMWDSRPDHDRHVLELAYEPRSSST
jgi:hypothetical protein